jgi:nucleoside-diphosphate-sugar epimerase
MQKTAIVCGAGGFIGSHLVKRLKADGYYVRGADLKFPEFAETDADDFQVIDLYLQDNVDRLIDFPADVIFQLAADMGGAGYINSGQHDAYVMNNNATINLNVLAAANRLGCNQVFFSSSACVYNEHLQMDADPDCREASVYPAYPDSEYGWEKLFSERMYLAYNRQYGMNNKIARFHNIFGELGTWKGGKEKSPAAICRKVAEATEEIEIWGDGKQLRSFLHIDDCVEGVMKLIASDFSGPVNIGSDRMITIDQLVDMVCEISGKPLKKRYIPGPQGVRSRNSNNDLIKDKLDWVPKQDLRADLTKTYNWISEQINTSG